MKNSGRLKVNQKTVEYFEKIIIMIHYLFARALTQALELLLIRTKSFRLVPDDTENGSVADCWS